MTEEEDNRAMEGCKAPTGVECDAKKYGCVPGERDPSHDHCRFGEKPKTSHGISYIAGGQLTLPDGRVFQLTGVTIEYSDHPTLLDPVTRELIHVGQPRSVKIDVHCDKEIDPASLEQLFEVSIIDHAADPSGNGPAKVELIKKEDDK